MIEYRRGGCDNCYALIFAARLKEMGQARYQHDGDPRTSGPGFDLTLHPDTLNLPRSCSLAGESGPGARPMPIELVRDIRDQATRHTVPFFFLQWGGVNRGSGRLLDGRTWDQMPVRRNHLRPILSVQYTADHKPEQTMNTMTEVKIEPPVLFVPNFLNPTDNLDWFEKSRALEWTRGEIMMYGKKIAVPREESLFGDDYRYEYRGSVIQAKPWPDFLLEARNRIQALSGLTFNFAVGNRYMTGKDSIGWHSDSFPQIGKSPAIASLSLGSTRRFKLRHNESGQVIDYDLESGALLIMLPGCQEEWEHAVLKTSRPVGERINWTFRPHRDAQTQTPN